MGWLLMPSFNTEVLVSVSGYDRVAKFRTEGLVDRISRTDVQTARKIADCKLELGTQKQLETGALLVWLCPIRYPVSVLVNFSCIKVDSPSPVNFSFQKDR